jgi:subtilase family serine protease
MRPTIRAVVTVISVLAMTLAPGIFLLPAAAAANGRAGEDLTVQAGSYGISPSPARLQDVLTINVTVINQGTQNSSSFVVAFYLNNTTNNLARKTVTSLAQGASENVTCTWDTRTTETKYFLSGINYTILVCVDYDNRIAEQDETNNNFTFNQSLGLERACDLKLVGFTLSPPNPVRGETVTVEVRMTNTGEITAKFFKVYIYADDINNSISSVDVSPLNVSEYRNVTLYWNTSGTTAGIHALLVYLNPEFYFNRVNELSWSDNNGSRQVTVARPEQRLELTMVEISPAETHMGDTLYINCSILNNGSAVENFTAMISLDGGDVLNQSVGLEPGQSTALGAEVDTSIYNAGNHTVRVAAGNIDRTMMVVILPMRRADLVPRNVTFLPLLPKAGQTVSVSFEAANEGSATSNPCGIGLYADYTLTPAAMADLPPLGPGESQSVNLSWKTSGISAGSHWLRVSVDTGKVVVESNESNNNYVWQLALDGDIDLMLDNMSIRPSSPRVGETAQFSVRVQNIGTMSCAASSLTLKAAGAVVDSKSLGMIAPGSGLNATLKWTTSGMAAGASAYELAVEPSGGAMDVRPQNNILAGTLELQPPPPAPDLRVSAIVFLNESPRAGDVLGIRVTIENSGNIDSGPSALMVFFVNGSALLRFTDVPMEVPSIPAGGSVQVDVARTTRNFREGTYSVNASVDYRNDIHELNESNNNLAVPMDLLPALEKTPALKVEGVTLDGKLEAGASVSITATVANSGDGDAYGVLVWFIIDGIHVGNFSLDQVRAGTNRTASYLWTPKEGTHTVSASAQTQDTSAAMGPQSQVAVLERPHSSGGGNAAGALVPIVVIAVVLAGAGGAALVLLRRKRPPASAAAPSVESVPAPLPQTGPGDENMAWER